MEPPQQQQQLMLPATDQQRQLQERLLKGGHNLQLNQVPTPESRALYAACSEGAGLANVQSLLSAGANGNWYNNHKGGEMALHAASRRTDPDAVRIAAALVDAGAMPSVISLPEFNTPLHLAAAAGNLETVKLLVEWHLNNSSSSEDSASSTPAPATAALILRQGNAYGNTPLHEASINGHDGVVAYLLATDDHISSLSPAPMTAITAPLIHLPNKRGSTPLLFALYGRPSKALVERLLARGADPMHTDHDGVGVLHLCASQGHEHLLPLFLDRFRAMGLDLAASVSRPDANGHTPGFYAQMQGSEGVVRVLQREAAAGDSKKKK